VFIKGGLTSVPAMMGRINAGTAGDEDKHLREQVELEMWDDSVSPISPTIFSL